MNPFDYVKSVSSTKENLITDEKTEKLYVPFIVNRALSRHIDTILYANEMNRLHHLDNALQYDFFLNSIRKRKRPFVPWVKNYRDGDLEAVMEYFDYSASKAQEIIDILSQDQLDEIKTKLIKGGVIENEHKRE